MLTITGKWSASWKILWSFPRKTRSSLEVLARSTHNQKLLPLQLPSTFITLSKSNDNRFPSGFLCEKKPKLATIKSNKKTGPNSLRKKNPSKSIYSTPTFSNNRESLSFIKSQKANKNWINFLFRREVRIWKAKERIKRNKKLIKNTMDFIEANRIWCRRVGKIKINMRKVYKSQKL